MTVPTDNTEGSLIKELEEILIGVLLGDGAMRKKKNALLEINHSINQKELVDWLYHKFQYIVGTPPKLRRGNGKRIAYRFTTRSIPILTKFYNHFFKGNKKIIPEDLRITPLTLAIWFMDDGSRCDKDIYLNTQQFSQKEQELLCRILKKQLSIRSSLNRDKHYWRIRIRKESVSNFMNLIKPFVLPEFSYKLLL